MNLTLGIGIALVVCAVAQAADPPASARAKPAAIPASQGAPPKSASRSEPRKPLDLRVGDVREYMKTEELEAFIEAPDPDTNTVVVEGTRLLPMEKIENVPGGLGSLWYAAKHPTNLWRIFAPVVNAPALEKPNPVPPPIFRWGP